MRAIDADEFECVILKNYSDEFAEGAKYILEKIDNASTLEYLKYGKWILRPKNKWNKFGYYCSECGRCVKTIINENVYDKYPYCYCGCKMKKEE